MSDIKKGIVHFWNLPSNVSITLDSQFKTELITKFAKVTKNKSTSGLSRTTHNRYIGQKNTKFRLEFLLKIINAVDDEHFNLCEIEKHISCIGAPNSLGITNPKIPFEFNSRQGARFLAAICNEGWISDGMYYSNFDQGLRNSVKSDALFVFGGNENIIKEWIKIKDKYLAFPSIMRDVIVLITKFKGVKSENNPPVPEVVFKNKEFMLGWIEQTIADEGCVKNYPETYRREISWKRSFSKNLSSYNLAVGEYEMLNSTGIIYRTYIGDEYKTKKGKEKVRVQIRLTKKENLLKLRRIIRIPHQRKDKIFTELTNSFLGA